MVTREMEEVTGPFLTKLSQLGEKGLVRRRDQEPSARFGCTQRSLSRQENVLKLLFSKTHLKTHRNKIEPAILPLYIKDHLGGNQWPPQLPSRSLQRSTVNVLNVVTSIDI